MDEPIEVDTVASAVHGVPDAILIIFASPETRCLGIAKKLDGYHVKRICVIRIIDEPNENRQANIEELEALCEGIAPIEFCDFKHSEPLFGIDDLASKIESVFEPYSTITVDISTFPRIALLLVLKMLSRRFLRRDAALRLLYSEAEAYSDRTGIATSGLSRVSLVPTFSATYTAAEELILILFLGYEGDRALGISQTIEPHRTIVAIPKPEMRAGWRGLSEDYNSALLAGLDKTDIYAVDPHNPESTVTFLQQVILERSWPDGTNFYIAPLGTKPQAVGVCQFCIEYPNTANVVYASPLAHADQYIAKGYSQAWELPAKLKALTYA